MEVKEEKKMTKQKIIIGIVLILLMFLSLIYIIIWIYELNSNEKNIDDLEKEVFISDGTESSKIEDENNTSSVETHISDEEKQIANKMQIDFDKLHEINPDVKGWLLIEKLNISYPILKSTDNEYYLERNVYKQKNIAGSIFLDYRVKEFEDTNTVIYGHNMKNDSMFGKLDEILKGNIDTDVDIYIKTKDKLYKYKTFSTYEIYSKDFKINESIEVLKDKSDIDFHRDIDLNSKYISLFTCTDSSVKRTILHAYLEKEM